MLDHQQTATEGSTPSAQQRFEMVFGFLPVNLTAKERTRVSKILINLAGRALVSTSAAPEFDQAFDLAVELDATAEHNPGRWKHWYIRKGTAQLQAAA